VLSLPPVATAGAQGKVRKRPYFSAEHGDAHPLLTFAPTAEVVDEQTFESAFIVYPVVVALFLQKGATLQSEEQLRLMTDLRDAARRALWRPYALPGIPAQIDCDYDPEPAFDLGGLDELFDVSLQLFRFKVSDTRG
jgi:hypothetical protein